MFFLKLARSHVLKLFRAEFAPMHRCTIQGEGQQQRHSLGSRTPWRVAHRTHRSFCGIGPASQALSDRSPRTEYRRQNRVCQLFSLLIGERPANLICPAVYAKKPSTYVLNECRCHSSSARSASSRRLRAVALSSPPSWWSRTSFCAVRCSSAVEF